MHKITRRLLCTTRTLRCKDSSDNKGDKARKSLIEMAKELPSTVSEDEYFFKKDRERIKQLRDDCLKKHSHKGIIKHGSDNKNNNNNKGEEK